jgi:hypothetical protein
MSDHHAHSSGGEDTSPDENGNEAYIESPTSTPPPPTPDEISFQYRHTTLKNFGDDLHLAAKTLFPNDSTSRYTKTSILILSWEDEDPNLPVSLEISKLYTVFKKGYGFEVDVWKIPRNHSHFELNQKIGGFVRPEEDDRQHLKIVYYAGHARLAKNRTLVWTGYILILVFSLFEGLHSLITSIQMVKRHWAGASNSYMERDPGPFGASPK